MKTTTCILMLFSLLAINHSQAKMVEYIEDIYSLQAPAEIAKEVNEIILQNSFTNDYEVVVPKKAGMQINPWNKLISSGKNPATDNIFILINPEWFAQLTHDEKNFLITRAFLYAQCGATSLPLKAHLWIFAALSILLMVGLYYAISAYRVTAKLNRSIRIIITIATVSLLNLTIVNRLQRKIVTHLTSQVNININNQALEKSGVRKEVAIQALTRLDNAVKENIKNGELFWKPLQTIFEEQIQALQ